MDNKKLIEISKKIKNIKIGVCGDLCLDAYWLLSNADSEISVETGLTGEAVEKHYYTLGGALNVVANLVSLKSRKIYLTGVIGDDIYGREIIRQLDELNVDTGLIVIQKENFSTITFGKKYLNGKEEPRLDFGFFNRRMIETDKIIINNLKEILQKVDVLIFNQQVPNSINNEIFIKDLNKLFGEFNHKIILLDSRHYSKIITNTYRKMNSYEAAILNNVNVKKDDTISFDDIKKYAENLYLQFKKPVFITRGPKGILTFDSDGLYEVPGIQLLKKIDTVGAGDTVTSALALCLGAGIEPREAAEFANLAANITIQKLYQTGTASIEEILELFQNIKYIYKPELAKDLRKAIYFKNTEIEICYDICTVQKRGIKHAVFDHDGTISTLRQGWEEIMETMIIKSILGEKYNTTDINLVNEIHSRVVDFIDKSTGTQTIFQMAEVVELIREFGIVPEDKIRDKFYYKGIYNETLMEKVNKRVSKIKKGELEISDFTIKGAIKFLKALRQKGIKLYLVSGTDYSDTLNEAKILGYADLFDGGIFGASNKEMYCSKKMVIENIMINNNLSDDKLIVFGDGPVEIRECCKRKGIAVGVASDEIRRYGLNLRKRIRLIESGSHIIIPDFSQIDDLMEILL